MAKLVSAARPHSSYRIFSDDVVSVIRSNSHVALVTVDKKLQSGGKWDLLCLFVCLFLVYSILQSASSGSE